MGRSQQRLSGISRRVPLLAAVALAACLAVAIAGDVAVSSPAPRPATPRAVPPAQYTGTQLAAALAPQSAFPAGFAPVKTASTNSGDGLLTAPATTNLAKLGCAALETTNPQLGMSAYATAGVEAAGTVSGQAYIQVLEQYATAARAAVVFSEIRAAAARCTSFTANSARVAQRVTSAPPVDGHAAFLIQQSIVDLNSLDNGVFDELYVLSGLDIIVIGREGYNNPAPDAPPEASLAAEVIARIRALPLPRLVPGQLAGTQLASGLLPASDFPATYTVDPTQTGDSGSTYMSGKPGSASSSSDCQLPPSAPDTRGMTAFAGMVLQNSAGDELAQEVFQFGMAPEASSYMKSLLARDSRCLSGTTTVNGSTVAYTMEIAPTAPVAGHETYLVTMTGTSNDAPYDSDALIVVSGTDIYTIAAQGPDISVSDQEAYLAWLMPRLIARVQALPQNG
jgi:hypothetical protein